MDKARQEPEQEANQEERQHQPMPYNPRLVFNDPDAFFLDLLTEQRETM